MDQSPPTKPPRGVKAAKETSGLLMSVIRTLSASETNEQRDREKAKLENDYKICDHRVDELVSKHGTDLSKVMHLFGSISQIVASNRERIKTVKENLQDCKKKLRCRKDELKNLWIEGLEYKYMLQLVDEIEKMNQVPNRLSYHMGRKQYLHATMLLVDAVNLGKETLEGVESLKELSLELEQKKEQLHLQLLSELKHQLYTKPSQHILALRRQGSGREGLTMNSPLQRSLELRRSGRNSSSGSNNMFSVPSGKNGTLDLDFLVEEKLDVLNPDNNYNNFVAVLVKSLCILEKLPFAVNEIMQEMHFEISHIVDRTTHYVKNYFDGLDQRLILKELIQIIFEQLKAAADYQYIFLKCVDKASKAHNIEINLYDINFYWSQVQVVISKLTGDNPLLTMALDVLENGLRASSYQKRAAMLHNIFDGKEQPDGSLLINCEIVLFELGYQECYATKLSEIPVYFKNHLNDKEKYQLVGLVNYIPPPPKRRSSENQGIGYSTAYCLRGGYKCSVQPVLLVFVRDVI